MVLMRKISKNLSKEENLTKQLLQTYLTKEHKPMKHLKTNHSNEGKRKFRSIFHPDVASHHLRDLTEKGNFKSNNVRNNFLRACGEKFSTLIESREASVGIRYTPQELFTTYKIYQDNERNEQKSARGNSPHIYNLRNLSNTPPKKPQKDKEHLMTLDKQDFIPKRVAKSRQKPKRSNFRLELKMTNKMTETRNLIKRLMSLHCQKLN